MNQPHHLFRFGFFELDTLRHELRRKGHPVSISGATMDLLLLLLSSRGALVTRQEIIATLWKQPESVDVVQGVNTAITRLRAVLGDQASSPRFVQTVVGRGYRFVAPVEVVGPVEGEPAEGEASSATAPKVEGGASEVETGAARPNEAAPMPLQLSRRRKTIWMTAVLLLVALFAEHRIAQKRRDLPQRIDSIAILPVLNLSGNPQQEYLADGITDEMIGDLAQMVGVRVVSRTSVMQFKGANPSMTEVGRKLGVDAVVEGSLLRDGDRFRMILRLVDARDDRPVWARTYTESSGTLDALAAQASNDLSVQIQRTGTTGGQVQTARYVPSSKAYDLYLQGRYASQKHTPEDVRRTIELYKETIQADPHFAQAYASLAGNYLQLIAYNLMPQAEALSLAERAARKAIELDDLLPGAHSSMALVKAYVHWDWAGAEAEDRLAIRLDNEARFHANLGTLLAQVGRSEEALRENRLAVQMEPTSLAINAQLAESLYLARRYDEAIQQAQNTLRMEPGFYEAAETLAKALHEQGRNKESIEVMKRSAGPILGMSYPRALMVTFYAALQQRRESDELFRALKRSAVDGQSAPCDVALAEAGQDYVAQAAQQLQWAYQSHDACVISIQAEPLYDPLRQDERFMEVQRRLAFR